MIAALANEDRLPHDRAVWREGRPPESVLGFRQVSVDYGDGLIERTFVDKASWTNVVRWRFGWPPA
jgi:hypothetical protein